jgi:uncharacterized small protein (DUF1192 family)
MQGVAQKRCPRHSGELVLLLCEQCSETMCAVCAGIDHGGHPTKTLADVTKEMSREYLVNLQRCERYSGTLQALLDKAPAKMDGVHAYIDAEVTALEEVLDAQREQLHADVEDRHARMAELIDAEVARCEAELQAIDDGRDVLEAIASSDGLVEAEVGQLIHGTMTYDDFWQRADCALHDPARMLHMLRLQLPMQNMQEVCDRLAWTEQSVADAPVVFPAKPTVTTTTRP